MIVLYTDGVTDALNLEEEEFGVARLIQVLQEHASQSAQKVTAAVLHAVHTFTQGAPQFDDLTLVVVKREA